MPSFAIVDPSLKDKRGHHFNLATRIARSVRMNGFEPLWFCHRDGVFCDSVDAEIVPVFGMTLYDAYQDTSSANRLARGLSRVVNYVSDLIAGIGYQAGSADGLANRHEMMARDLMSALAKTGLNSNDRLLFHTADGMTYAALNLVLARLPPDEFPLVHICTPYDPLSVMPNRVKEFPIHDCIQNWAARGLIGRRVFLYGETGMLAAHLSEQWKTLVRPLDLPALTPPRSRAGDTGLKAEQFSLTIAHLGPARIEKGFHLLPDIVNRTLEFLGAEGTSTVGVSFVIQCNAQITGYSEPILKAIERLKGYPQCVTLLSQTLSDAEYTNRLAAADVVLLPYAPREYGKRSSGVVAEALSLGKIIVATRDSYPGSAVQDGAGATASTPLEFGRKLVEIAKDAEKYRKAAYLLGAEYRKSNRLQDYVRKCLAAEQGTTFQVPSARQGNGLCSVQTNESPLPFD